MAEDTYSQRYRTLMRGHHDDIEVHVDEAERLMGQVSMWLKTTEKEVLVPPATTFIETMRLQALLMGRAVDALEAALNYTNDRNGVKRRFEASVLAGNQEGLPDEEEVRYITLAQRRGQLLVRGRLIQDQLDILAQRLCRLTGRGETR